MSHESPEEIAEDTVAVDTFIFNEEIPATIQNKQDSNSN